MWAHAEHFQAGYCVRFCLESDLRAPACGVRLCSNKLMSLPSLVSKLPTESFPCCTVPMPLPFRGDGGLPLLRLLLLLLRGRLCRSRRVERERRPCGAAAAARRRCE